MRGAWRQCRGLFEPFRRCVQAIASQAIASQAIAVQAIAVQAIASQAIASQAIANSLGAFYFLLAVASFPDSVLGPNLGP